MNKDYRYYIAKRGSDASKRHCGRDSSPLKGKEQKGGVEEEKTTGNEGMNEREGNKKLSYR